MEKVVILGTGPAGLTSAGTGCMASLDAERYLEGNAVYDWIKSL